MAYFEMNDRKKIGLGLTAFGILFSFLGIILFFDKGLLAMGNILFLSGVTITIGPKSAMQFFMKRSNFKGTISFGVGFFLVVIGWPVLGMILEAYGFIVLFSGFWPTLSVFVQKIPIIGWVFQQPFVRSSWILLLRSYSIPSKAKLQRIQTFFLKPTQKILTYFPVLGPLPWQKGACVTSEENNNKYHCPIYFMTVNVMVIEFYRSRDSLRWLPSCGASANKGVGWKG
ncbi:hypothetical protein CsSME_00044581 [Camellia sinensis var. sinensis]